MRVGFHLGIAGGLVRAVEEAARLGLSALQIFSGNPRGWRRRPLEEAVAADFRAGAARAGLDPVVVHAPYLLNLASPKDDFWRRSIDLLADELIRAGELGCRAVVMHPGSRGKMPLEWGLDRIALGVIKAREMAPRGVQLWLENTAGGGGQLGGPLSQLQMLLARLPAENSAACLDTAHAWGMGYRLDSAKSSFRFLNRVERVLGLNRVKLWHFNDSDRPRGSRADRHQHLGRGLLGRQGLGGLLNEPRLAEAVFIMETPKNSRWADRRNLAYFQWLRNGGK